jgi:glycosyltransferase involved in cell wall biosynthesis
MATAQQYGATDTVHVPPREGAFCRPWRVLHASENAGGVDELVQAQQSVGMHPSIVTPSDAAEASAGLLHAWNDVRHWRKLLQDGGAEAVDLIHAHGFASGMAAVRNWSGVVYEINAFVENTPGPNGANSWIGRSFRVAEQFVISRAGAVVVHTHGIRKGVLERGGAGENVFVIPDPVEADEFPLPRHRHAPVLSFYIADVPTGPQINKTVECLIEAAVKVDAEVGPAMWWLESDEIKPELREKALLNGIEFRAVKPNARPLAEADVVISFGAAQRAVNSVAMSALRAGRALLAADVDGNRDVTPEGAGCLWFRDGDPRELAGRAIFLARNTDFCRALGDAGHRYVLDCRSADAVARQYDSVYRHALARRRSGSSAAPLLTHLQPLQCLL